jgi:hypothetical protein
MVKTTLSQRGDVEGKLNTVNMTAWVHKECDSIQTGSLTKLQEARDSSEQKDECFVCLEGVASSGRKDRIDVSEWAERRKVRAQIGRSWEGWCCHYSQQLLAKTPSHCVITKQCCVLSRNGWDKEEKQH